MDRHDELDRLAEMIERLLKGFNALKENNNRLAADLQQKEGQIALLEQKIAALEDDKRKVCQRVDGLITAMESWEKELDELQGDEPGES